MKTSLTKGLDSSEKSEVEASFKSSYLLRTILVKRLKDKIEEAKKEARGKQCYENPNWPYLQADLVGYERALETVISMLDGK